MQFLSKHLARLNSQQLQAVLAHPSGALQILAGPGTGKTRVMALRATKIIIQDGITPESILIVTFGRHPAQELCTRLKGLIGPGLTDNLRLGTIHTTCFKYIKAYKVPNTSIWGDGMCQHNIRHIARCHVSGEALNQSLVSKLQNAIAQMKVYAGTRRSLPELIYRSLKPGIDYDIFVRTMRDHNTTMRNSNALDFDDLVNMFLELVQKKPSLVSHIRHILVDEL
ncbi:hypothetical protein OPQ81_003189 [Rhizoctonia solani]|nr:hypothetical protein OPQ81_003189 [Rhizoctonia solani]